MRTMNSVEKTAILTVLHRPGFAFTVGQSEIFSRSAVKAKTLLGVGIHLTVFVGLEDFLLPGGKFPCLVGIISPN